MKASSLASTISIESRSVHASFRNAELRWLR